MGNSTPVIPKTPKPIVTKICMGDYVGEPYPTQNFMTIQTIRLLLFDLPRISENTHQVTQLVFLVVGLVLPTAYSQDPCTDFYDQYIK